MSDWQDKIEEESENPFDRMLGRQIEAEIGFRRRIAASGEKWESKHIRALARHVSALIPLDNHLEKLDSYARDKEMRSMAFKAYETASDAEEIPKLSPKDVPFLIDEITTGICTALRIWHSPNESPPGNDGKLR